MCHYLFYYDSNQSSHCNLFLKHVPFVVFHIHFLLVIIGLHLQCIPYTRYFLAWFFSWLYFILFYLVLLYLVLLIQFLLCSEYSIPLQFFHYYFPQLFFLQNIRSNKNFGNPYIFGKAVEHFQIDEIGSNYPRDIFDPHGYTEVNFFIFFYFHFFIYFYFFCFYLFTFSHVVNLNFIWFFTCVQNLIAVWFYIHSFFYLFHRCYKSIRFFHLPFIFLEICPILFT